MEGAGTSSAALLTAARGVLTGVNGTTLNDASVTTGEAATTAFISGSATAITTTAAAASLPLAAANDPITISASNSVIDPGAGGYTIQFLAGATADTLVLHSGGADQIAGFDLAGGDVLDLRGLLAGAGLNVQDVLPAASSDFTIQDQGANAVLMFDPLGHGGGGAVAVLGNLGGVVTSFSALTSHNAVLM